MATSELKAKGRSDAHKVTILITTASWENVGTNPYESIKQAKDMGECRTCHKMKLSQFESSFYHMHCTATMTTIIVENRLGRPSLNQKASEHSYFCTNTG